MTKPYAYDEDEFDALGADRVPVGVHRRPVPWWRHALPFIVVLVLAPVLAFTVVQVWSQESDPGTDPTPPAAATTDGTTDPAGGETTDGQATDGETTGSEETTGEESPTEEETTPAEDLNLDLSVWVLNGAGVSGLAGETAARLEDEGWTNVSAGDYSNELPTETAIFYTNAEMAAEAEAIGEQLGITVLYESADAASNGVVIVLRPDFL